MNLLTAEERDERDFYARQRGRGMGPGPADYRFAFRALYAVERLHRLVDTHGVVHMRDSDKGDGPYCDPRVREDGLRYDTQRGRAAITGLTCRHCIREAAQLLLAADEDREAIEAELRGMDATRGVVVALVRAAGGRA